MEKVVKERYHLKVVVVRTVDGVPDPADSLYTRELAVYGSLEVATEFAKKVETKRR